MCFKMVHSNTKNAKSKVHQSQVCYLLCTTHSSVPKHVIVKQINSGKNIKELVLLSVKNQPMEVDFPSPNFVCWYLNHPNLIILIKLKIISAPKIKNDNLIFLNITVSLKTMIYILEVLF